jgi:hypothetical protein
MELRDTLYIPVSHETPAKFMEIFWVQNSMSVWIDMSAIFQLPPVQQNTSIQTEALGKQMALHPYMLQWSFLKSNNVA